MGLIVAEFEVADPPERWAAVGFAVGDDGRCRVGTVSVRLRGRDDGKKGIRSWSLHGTAVDGADAIDGMPTFAADGDPPEPTAPADHPNGALFIDHAVMASPDLDRTVRELRRWGLEPRRERRTGTYGSPMRQVFFRLGEVILEVVGAGEPDPATRDRRAGFFGLAFTVADLDATKALLGHRLGDPKDAVQPGRRIATLRTRDAGISTAIAFMSQGDQEYG
jgi:hypothetical protein